MRLENNMMTEVLYQFDDVDQTKEEPEQSCKMTTNGNIYDVNTEAGISHAQDKN